MLSDNLIPGTLSQYDVPDWQPLRDLVGMDLADWFMWMHEIELEDETIVHAYKHIATRRYFHLAADDRAFAYTPGGLYREILPRAGAPGRPTPVVRSTTAPAAPTPARPAARPPRGSSPRPRRGPGGSARGSPRCTAAPA